MSPHDPDPDHSCEFVRELALQTIEASFERRQKGASDARKRQMVENCNYYDYEERTCAVDDGKPCREQCGDKGALVDHIYKLIIPHGRTFSSNTLKKIRTKRIEERKRAALSALPESSG